MAVKSSENLLLRLVSQETLSTLGAETHRHAITTVLTAAGELPEFLFFPHDGALVSVVVSTAEETTVEAGVVGRDGLVSVHAILTGPAPTPSDLIVPLPMRRRPSVPLLYRALLELSLMRSEVRALAADESEMSRLMSRIETAESIAARLLDEIETRSGAGWH